MSKNLSPACIAAWRGLLTVHARVVARIEASLSTADLPPLGWYDVLFALHEQPTKSLRMAELADQVLLSRSGLTRLIDNLEKEGLLKREPCATDKRGLHVRLTAAGTDTLRRIWPTYRKGIDDWFSRHLTDDQITTLQSIFDKVNAANQTASR